MALREQSVRDRRAQLRRVDADHQQPAEPPLPTSTPAAPRQLEPRVHSRRGERPARSHVTAKSHVMAKVGAYVALTKPRIIELLLITTLPTMIVAKGALPSVGLMAATLVGGALAAGGANAINMVVDRDIDKVMHRTRNRPLVTGAVTARSALVFALALEVIAFVELWLLVNLLSAVLAVSATLFYVFVYTLWLKRRSTQNIVIGGAAGAVPVLVGWAAVTNSLSWAPLVMFAIIFTWTPPHFWALAVRYRDDYREAHVPMLPAVAPLRRTTAEILVYTAVLVGLTILLAPVAHLGALYLVVASVTGAVYLLQAARLWRLARAEKATGKDAMRLFAYSITYLTVLFVAMAADVLLRHYA
jgi:protoheme IX farnesyltransferase